MSATVEEIIPMSKLPGDKAVPLRPERGATSFLSRRDMLAVAAAGGALLAAGSAHAADPGPRNPALQSQFPDAVNPPATDVGELSQFWASFNNAHKRIQSGGWARQVTQADFPIASAVSGVNMRLGPGGIRELHWHQAAEWAYMTN